MKKNKIIMLITITSLYLIVLAVVVIGNDKLEKNKKNNDIKRYIIVDNFAKLSFSNNSWLTVSTGEIEAYGKMYKVFINNNNFGNYKMIM